MSVSPPWFRSALVLAGLLMAEAWIVPAFGQSSGKTPLSPVAPGDLSKPVFDTNTPVYGTGSAVDKAASTVVAEVEGRPITMGDVGDAIRVLPPGLAGLPFDTLYPTVLEQLIQREALVVRAQRQGVDEDPAIRRRVRSAADRQLAEEYMQHELAAQITEAGLLERYNRDIAGKPGADVARVRVILTDTEKQAEDAIAELHGGADFTSVARRVSKDTSAATGGDLGFNPRDKLVPEVAAVAFATPPGQLVPAPVRGASGWFVVKVEERRPLPTPSYAQAREALRQTMLREGVAPLAAAALNELNVRRYSFTGREPDAATPGAR
jgi:peptidyl-prolyl cis-trans isomerase C